MQNKKSIPLTMLAIFSMTILLTFELQNAYALEQFSVAMPQITDGRLIYVEGINSYVAQRDNLLTYYITNAQTKSVDSYTLALSYGLIGSIGNTCFGYDVIVGADTLNSWACETGTSLSTISLPASGDPLNGDMATGSNVAIIIGDTIYLNVVCDTVSRSIFIHYSDALIETGRTGSCASDLKSISGSTGVRHFTVAESKLAVTTTGSTFQIFSLGTTDDRDCTVASATGQGILRHNALWYVYTTTSQRIDTFNASCVDTGDITSTQHQLSDTLTNIRVDTSRGEFYISSLTQTAVMNSTTPTVKLYEFNSVSSNIVMQTSAVASEFDQYATISHATQVLTITQLDAVEAPVGSLVCFDINDSPETTTLVCYTDEDGDGIADFPFSGGLGSASQLVSTSVQNIAEQIGLVAEGSDIQTNGLGYFMVVIGMALMIVMFYLGSGGELGKIPTFVWMLGALGVLGAFAGFGFVDITFFIVSILVIIALSSIKVVSSLERF
jgi:hypothetical protein